MRRTNDRRYLSAVIRAGSLWGIAEATLGFALHTASRVAPVPNISGAVMFPVALAFMLYAVGATRRSHAALSAAVVAAAIKAGSLVLPGVSFIFVRNPIVAIVAEGAVVTVGASLYSLKRNGWLLAKVLTVAVGWRVLFLGVNLAFGIRSGILAKPLPTIMSFLWIDSLLNTALFGAALWFFTGRTATAERNAKGSVGIASPLRLRTAPQGLFATPVVLIVALAVEMVASSL